MLRCTFFLLFIGLITNSAIANCNFVSAEHLDKLSKPKSIRLINVEIPKSSKFNRNFTRIIVSKSENIPPELRKRFKAKVTVVYDFGNCAYEATIRQTGDWKDHVKFTSAGKPLSSLNIKLKEGNIMNAVKFKLLIPETRKNLHEVFGTVLMRELGFIAPETFQVKAKINNVDSLMLFQEDAQKEMLERNSRREGPLFEGDESLLWSYMNYKTMALENLALARMTNRKWFLKGQSSQHIALNSYNRLQKAYLNYSQNIDSNELVIAPNERKNSIFEEYFITLLAMNGSHGLRPHNRKFYYNSFINQFEPIYYDGHLMLGKLDQYQEKLLKTAFTEKFKNDYKNTLIDFKRTKKTLNNFMDRVLISEKESKNFFENQFENTKKNITALMTTIKSLKNSKSNFYFSENLIQDYIKNQIKHNVDQILISSMQRTADSYVGLTTNNDKLKLTQNEVSKIISDNVMKETRTVYLSNEYRGNSGQIKNNKSLEKVLKGKIISSKGLEIILDKIDRKIILKQSSVSDWVLIKDVDLSNWTVEFLGVKDLNLNFDQNIQRFNSYGMTGCLNLYAVVFDKTSIKVNGGGCEDSVNIIKSYGNLKEIEVNNAHADAVDVDFSKINVDFISVNFAGNDCIDVSGGIYILKEVKVINCGDKGLSVGEDSRLTAKKIFIDEAEIGISSKDSSITKIHNAIFQNIKTCYESVKKKQEFWGAQLNFKSIDCSSNYNIDSNSTVSMGKI